ncbi:dihydrofolate reductase family protein [Ramlibacter sp.]|uniref:dihydrofolate reductase family protein n=1 Tax=Ramlibacter sp. TaxID=1917967 RepID=UPI0035B2B873
MQSVCRVFIATSLDGFIARPDGSIDWLEQANQRVPAGEDCGYGAFMDAVDALVMGRATFDTVRHMSPWPYGDKPVYVLSRTMPALPAGTPASVRLIQGEPATVVSQVAAHGHRSLYVDGGLTIQAFLAAGVITELVITVVPVLIGAGRPLFGPLPGTIELSLMESRAYPFGFVQSRYAVRQPPDGDLTTGRPATPSSD